MSERTRLKTPRAETTHSSTHKPAAQDRQPHNDLFQDPLLGLDRPLQPNTIVNLQSTIGNAAVQRLIQAQFRSPGILQRVTPATTTAPARAKPTWAADRKQTRAIQEHLKRIGTYRYRVDGKYGPYTDSALVEAFGGPAFRTMDYTTTLTKVAAAKPISGTRGHRMLRYGEMFRDGVLDITIGIGFDEKGHDKGKLTGIVSVLAQKGFITNDAKARKLLKQAGRPFTTGVSHVYFVKENLLTYTPPAGSSRPIHAVVRLISNTGNTHGAKAAQSFQEGMAGSDVTYYTGHGRFGSGPDFNRNFDGFILYDKKGKPELLIKDYKVLQHHLKKEGKKSGRGPWSQFLWRARKKRIEVLFSNAGNLYLNKRNYHPSEFGAKLIFWALKKGKARLATGPTGSIAQEMQKAGDRRYRVVVFAGCRTKDYHSSLRGTPGLGKKNAHLLETNRKIKTTDSVDIFEAFFSGLIAQFSANEIVKKMDLSQEDQLYYTQKKHRWYRRRHLRGTFRNRGTKYDPRVR